MHLSISAAAAITLAAVPAAAEVYIKEQFDRVSLHRHLEDGAVRRGRRDEADSSSSYFFGGPGPGTLARRLGHVEIYADYILVATWKNEKIDDAAMTPTMQIPATESSTVDSRKTVPPTLPLFSVPPPHPGRCPCLLKILSSFLFFPLLQTFCGIAVSFSPTDLTCIFLLSCLDRGLGPVPKTVPPNRRLVCLDHPGYTTTPNYPINKRTTKKKFKPLGKCADLHEALDGAVGLEAKGRNGGVDP